MIKYKIMNFLENLSEDEIKEIPIIKKLEVIYNYPEIKLFKELLIKSNDKLLLTKKYKNLSLKTKFLTLFNRNLIEYRKVCHVIFV